MARKTTEEEGSYLNGNDRLTIGSLTLQAAKRSKNYGN